MSKFSATTDLSAVRFNCATSVSNKEVQLVPHDFVKDPPAPIVPDMAWLPSSAGSLFATPLAEITAAPKKMHTANERDAIDLLNKFTKHNYG